MSVLNQFFVRYSHFLTGSVLSLLLGFVTFPILTRILSHEEYGMLGLVTTTMFLLVAFAKAGLSDGITRFYKQYSDTAERLTQFTSTLLVRGVALSGLTVILYLAVLTFVVPRLNIDHRYLICFFVMAPYLFVQPLNIIVLNILKVTGRTVLFNAISLTGKIIAICLSLLLLLVIIKELYGYFIGSMLAELILAAVLFYWFFSNYRINPLKSSGNLAVRLMIFGAPLLLTELSYLLLSYAARYMIVAFNGVDALGVYSVGYNLASYVADLVTFSLSYAIVPLYVEIYERDGKAKTEEFLSHCIRYLCIAVLPIIAGYFAVAQDLFVVLASDKYIAASTFSPLILIGSLMMGLNTVLNAGLYLEKKSTTILGIMLTAVLINIVANFLLLPAYGIVGAAVAALIACGAATALTVYLSFRYIEIRIDLKTVAYYLGFSLLMFLIVRNIHSFAVWINLVAKIMAGVLIIGCGVLLRERQLRNWLRGLQQLHRA